MKCQRCAKRFKVKATRIIKAQIRCPFRKCGFPQGTR